MPSGNENLARKDRLLAKLDPEHEVELEEAFMGPLAAAIRASTPGERQQALDKAIEAYMSTPWTMRSMRMGGSCSVKQSTSPEGRRTREEVGCRRFS
jgi:hypothetical protein